MTQRIVIYTLVDITPGTLIKVRDSNTTEYHQQQNLNVLLQSISLRSQPIEPQVIVHHQTKLSEMNFGKFYDHDKATVWSLSFYNEHDSIWRVGDDELANLRFDINGVAITSDLDNTVEFPVNIFDALDNINIYFEIH